jgi:thioredoxin 1
MGTPKVVTDPTFETEVLRSDQPVLVDFWATWCGPCRMVAPILEEIAKEQSEKLSVAKLDVDANPITAGRFGVRSIPTMILFKNGREAQRLVGYMPKERLLQMLSPHLGATGSSSAA